MEIMVDNLRKSEEIVAFAFQGGNSKRDLKRI
jgi:hypothetical protein